MVGLAALIVTGCARTQVQTVGEYGGGAALRRPGRVLVYDFAVSPDEVKLNRGVSTKVAGLLKKRRSPTDDEREVARVVANIVSAHLVQDIQALGLPAQHATAPPPAAGNVLVIEGHFVTVDEGDRMERMVIGFGLGATVVKTQVQVYDETATGRRLVEEFNTTAKGSIKPGMAAVLPVGAAVSGIGTAVVTGAAIAGVTEIPETVKADARRTAKEIAKKLEPLFVQHGWISPR